MLVEQIKHRFAALENLCPIAFGRGVVFAGKAKQFRLGHRTARVFRHDLDLLAGRDLLQLDEFGQQPADRDRIARRQLRATSLGDPQPDLIGRQEAEAARHRIDQRGIVAGHDAQMIADAIADAGGKLHFDVPGRALGSVWTGLVLQFTIDQYLQWRGAAEQRGGADRRRRDRLDLVQRLVVGAAAETGIEPERLHRRL